MVQRVAQLSESLIQTLKPHSKSVSVALSCFLVLLFGFLNYLSGPTVSLSVLYVIPIVLATWNVGQTNGIVMAAASAAVCLAGDLMGSLAYSHPAFPYLNAIMMFCLFLMVVLLVSQVRTANKRLRQAVAEKTANLEGELAERKRAEEELRKSEDKFRAIFDNTSDGMFLLDLEARKFFMCNATCATMLGYTQEGFSNLAIADIHPEEDLPFIYEQIGKFNRGERGIRSDIRFKRKDGSIFVVDLSPALLTIADKEYLVISFRDITERKQAEEALTKLSGAVRQTADSVVIASRDGIIEYVNPAFEKLTGYSKEEVIGKTPGILKSGEHGQEFYRALWETILSGRIFRAEFINKKKSGELYFQEETITPIVNGNERVMHFVSTGRDITERKRVEGKLRKSYEQLHQFAVHLQSAREEERSRIAREIHDELGQALTGLKFDISWIGKKLPEGTEELQDKTRSMGKLVDGTIQMVRRISSELRPGVLDRLGLAAAIEWQAQEFQDRTGIRCMLTPNFDGLKLDRDKAMAIFRIFQEALTNVARHANATAVDVNSSLESGNLMLEVRDNGRGIAENELLDPKSLGLLGMKERALAFGGRVNVVGNPGKGTKVILVIPCSPAENEADTS
jgi:PAS domain S-box-containing protein